MGADIIGRHRRDTVVRVTALPATAVRVIRRRPVMAVRRRVVLATAAILAVTRLAMGNRRGRLEDMPVQSASPVARSVRLREGNHNMCRVPARLISAATATEGTLGGLRLRRPGDLSEPRRAIRSCEGGRGLGSGRGSWAATIRSAAVPVRRCR
jgi:hypothetical protein